MVEDLMLYLISAIIIFVVIYYVILMSSNKSVEINFLSYYRTVIIYDNCKVEMALKMTIKTFITRAPFNQLTDEDVSNIVEITKLITRPENICAKLLQKCQNDPQKINLLKNINSLSEWVIIEHVCDNINEIMINAMKIIKDKDAIMDGILNQLRERTSWSFLKLDETNLLYNYNNNLVAFQTSNNALNVLKSILYEEYNYRCINPTNILDNYIKINIIDNFDKFFNIAWEMYTKDNYKNK